MLVCPLPGHASTVLSSGTKRIRHSPMSIPGSEVAPLPKKARRSRRLRREMVVLPLTMKGSVQQSDEKALDPFEAEITPVSPLSSESGVASAIDDSPEPATAGQVPGGFGGPSSNVELSDNSLEFSSTMTPASVVRGRNLDVTRLPSQPHKSPPSSPSRVLAEQTISRSCQHQFPGTDGKESTCEGVELPMSLALFHGKRMASLNASARVSAMMESRGRPQKTKETQNHSKKKTRAPPSKSPKGLPINAELMKSSQLEHSAVLESGPLVLEPLQACGAILAAPTQEGEGYGIMSHTASLTIPKCLVIVSQHYTGPEEEVELDAIEYNKQGVLYNGGTIHPNTRFFLTSEGQLPSRVLPFLVPAKPEALKDAMSLASQHRRFHWKPQAGKVSVNVK